MPKLPSILLFCIGSILSLFLFQSSILVVKPSKDFTPIPFSDIYLSGELNKRIAKNMDRMEEEKYRPDKVFLPSSTDNSTWPGDTEGRTVLALVLDAQAIHRKPKYLKEILKAFPKKMNKRGYFGPIYPDSVVSEQQLASHGWVLRALCEHYHWTKEAASLKMIQNIVNNLALPSSKYQSLYPIDPEKRKHAGSFEGTPIEQVGNWLLSSDTGCDFILLDGLVQAYQIQPTDKLKDLIEEMISMFLKIDQVGIKAQTHATLTTLRGLIRWYEVTGRKDLLSLIQDKYNTYKMEGMSENYENYNWYGRPEWTEPCAVIDSYILAVSLWRFTEKPEYLEDAHCIYYNGLSLEQRTNGGFGIQNCSGSKNSPFVAVTLEEAHWCCSMRGGEGLSRAAQYCFFTKGEREVAVPFYQNANVNLRFGDKYVKVKEISDYPYTGNILFKVLESDMTKQVSFKFFIPDWFKGFEVSIDGKKVKSSTSGDFCTVRFYPKVNTLIELKGEMEFKAVETVGSNSMKGYHTFRHGPMILGYAGIDTISLSKNEKFINVGGAKYKSIEIEKEVKLYPLYHIMAPEVSLKEKYIRQILFKKG